MEKEIIISDELFEEYLKAVKNDSVEWGTFMHSLSVELNLSDRDLIRQISLGLAEKLLKDDAIIVIREKLGEGTEVWDFNRNDVLHILRRDSLLLYENFPPKKSEYEITFIDKNKIENLKNSRSKPIILLKEPPVL